MFPCQCLEEELFHRWCFRHILTTQKKVVLITMQQVNLRVRLLLVGSLVCLRWTLPLASHHHQWLHVAVKVQNCPDSSSRLPSLNCLNLLKIKVHMAVLHFIVLFRLSLPGFLENTFCPCWWISWYKCVEMFKNLFQNPVMCFPAASTDRTRSPLRTSLRSLQAVRNSRSFETDDYPPADSQITFPMSGLDQLKEKLQKCKTTLCSI